MTNPAPFQDTFEHVVVLMLENRSYDNLLGFLPQPAPSKAQRYDGAEGHSNPGVDGHSRVPTTANSTNHMPFPDPGEYFDNCMRQLFGNAYQQNNPNPATSPDMSGFVSDYFQILERLANLDGPGEHRWPGDPSEVCNDIMKCHAHDSVPVLSQLASEFAVFDNWFCALPSATWPNRAFFHADTSYGWADNPTGRPGRTMEDWAIGSCAPTLFDQLQNQFPGQADSARIYSDQYLPLTQLVHLGSMGPFVQPTFVRSLEGNRGGNPNFYDDCAQGTLPKYSFLEPHFLNYIDDGLWHNDMHPSKWLESDKWVFWGPTRPGSVALGDQLILQVYEAIRKSSLRDKTLFIITFDENGGCYDHKPPPRTTAPDQSTYYGGKPEYGFDFQRLGARVPTVIISSHIAAQTIVHEELNHASFLKSMSQKWGLPPLGPRQIAATSFTETLTASEPRDWPPLSLLLRPTPNLESFPEEDDAPLNGLQASLIEGMRSVAERHYGVATGSLPHAQTTLEAQALQRALRPIFL